MPSIFLYYKIEIFKIFFKAHNDGRPELLSNNIYIERRNAYSLRGGGCLSAPRFETRFMKDSLAYRGTVLWCLCENGISHMSNKDRSLIMSRILNSTLPPPRLCGTEMPISHTIDNLLVDTHKLLIS